MAMPLDETRPDDLNTIKGSMSELPDASKAQILGELKRCYDDLHRFAVSFANDSDVAEDACQAGIEEFLTKGKPDMKKYRSLKPYLIKFVKLKIQQIQREKSRDSEHLKKWMDGYTTWQPIGPYTNAVMQERKVRIIQAVSKLPQKKRLALILWSKDISKLQISKELKVSVRTVRKYINNSKKQLRAELQKGEIVYDAKFAKRG